MSSSAISLEDRINDYKKLQNAGLICLEDDFMPTVHYPQITMYPPITQEALYETYTKPEDNRFVIYAHIPFCKKRCQFCHYPNIFGDHSSAEKDRYLTAMEKEIEIYMRLLGLDTIKARSILVGGGTPTFLSVAQLERFLKYFCSKVDLSQCTQFNYDVDPLTIIGSEGKERLDLLQSYGVNRLTIGTQSFDSEILHLMNRHHTSEDCVESIKMAQEMGFQLNTEFIFGYPGQSMDSWLGDIRTAISLNVDEIQIYRLKIIPYGDQIGTITKDFSKERDRFLSVMDTIAMKHMAIDLLNQNGYYETLRRVYAKNMRHFSHYAHDQCCNLFDCLGFGLTAFNSLRDRFGLNTQYFKEYYSSIEQGRLPLNRGLVRTTDDQMRWALLLPLKNRYVHKKKYQNRAGVSLNEVFRNKIEKLKSYGLLHEDNRKLELTPRGTFYADEVCQIFHSPKYMPFPESSYAKGDLNPYQS